jgi:hypothetical protein
MGNERLRAQLHQAGLNPSDLANAISVDPKTVERWITNDRLPHRRHRWETARLLGTEETYLWPGVATDARTAAASEAEFVQLYPHRGMVPVALWNSMISSAEEAVDVLVYSGLFLFDVHAELAKQLATKARSGAKVRLLLGDEDSPLVAQRGIEEGIGEDLLARIRLARSAIEPLREVPGVQLRKHSTPLYCSIYRFDSELLANTHVYGARAPQNPVLHLRRVPGGRLFDHYMRSYDQVWATAKPL